jgi:hypothetical protein
MHVSTMQYLKPSEEQQQTMSDVRAIYAHALEQLEAKIPNGRYLSLAVTELEASAMWANKAITRHSDGSPREGAVA